MFTVYHADETTFTQPHPAFSLDDRTGFTSVAIVEARNLEEVFCLTNHKFSQKPWWENDQVHTGGKTGMRSTSVGDVVVGNEGAFRCEMSGWSEIKE